MSDLNVLAIIGRLTRDAEMKTTASGKNYVRFSIAVNRTRKKGDAYVNIPSFFTLHQFNKSVEKLFPFLKKGQLVAIEGHLEQRTWDSQGEKRTSTEIIIDKLNLAGWRKEDVIKNELSDASSDGDFAEQQDFDSAFNDSFSNSPHLF